MILSNKIIGVIAPKGSGKTHAVCEYLRRQNRFAAFVIFRNDVGYLGPADEVIAENPRRLMESMSEENFRIVYHPSPPVVKDGDIEISFIDKFIDICFKRGNMLMVLDEAHMICTNRTMPPSLMMAMVDGRRRGLDILYVSHRFATVNRMLTTNTDEFWFWKIIEPADLDGIRGRCGVETMERVRALRRLEQIDGRIIPGEMLRWSTYTGLEEGESDGRQTERERERAGVGGDPGEDDSEDGGVEVSEESTDTR